MSLIPPKTEPRNLAATARQALPGSTRGRGNGPAPPLPLSGELCSFCLRATISVVSRGVVVTHAVGPAYYGETVPVTYCPRCCCLMPEAAAFDLGNPQTVCWHACSSAVVTQVGDTTQRRVIVGVLAVPGMSYLYQGRREVVLAAGPVRHDCPRVGDVAATIGPPDRVVFVRGADAALRANPDCSWPLAAAPTPALPRSNHFTATCPLWLAAVTRYGGFGQVLFVMRTPENPIGERLKWRNGSGACTDACPLPAELGEVIRCSSVYAEGPYAQLGAVCLEALPQEQAAHPALARARATLGVGALFSTLTLTSLCDLFPAMGLGAHPLVAWASRRVWVSFLAAVQTLSTCIAPGSLLSTAWWGSALRWRDDPTVGVVGVCSEQAGEDLVIEDTMSLSATVPRVLPTCADRVLIALVGPALRGAVPLIYRSCVHNEIVAVRKRLGNPDLLWFDPAVDRAWLELHTWLRGAGRAHYWDRLLEAKGPGPIVPIPFLTWVQQYGLGARQVLIQARSDAQYGITADQMKAAAFIKVEKNPFHLDQAEVKAIKPRLIQGRHPMVTSRVTPTLAAYGKLLRAALSSGDTVSVFYCAGSSAEQLGEWYRDCVARGLRPKPYDVTAWDASVGPQALASRNQDYLDLGVSPVVQQVTAARLAPRRGRTKCGVRYRVHGQVWSGDGDTSSGNSGDHAKIWTSYLVRGGFAARVAINGDNALGMRDPGDAPDFDAGVEPHFRSLGFEVRPEGVGGDEFDGEVCSGRLWSTGGTYVYGPKIGRVLSKTFWMSEPVPSQRKRLRWLRGTALGLLRDTAFVPILRVVVRRLVAETEGVKPGVVAKEEWKIHATDWHAVDERTIEQFCYLYGLSRLDLESCEAYLHSLPTLLCTVLDHPVLTRIVEVDL